MPPKRKAAVTAETKSKKQKNEEEEVQEEGEEHEEAMETKDLGNNWKIDNSVVRHDPPGLKGSALICAFDIDDTIIRTKSGKTFAQNINDWELWHQDVPKKLEEYSKKGYKIVFISNQSGIAKGHVTADGWAKKITKVIEELKIPIQVFASTSGAKFRKPALGMWKMFEETGNENIKIDYENSIYVGDAAGREKGWAPGKKKDFADTDRKFALNLGTKFLTPEEFFLGQAAIPFVLHGFDPKTLKKDAPLLEPKDAKLTQPHQELIVMCGYPASGKSFFSKNQLGEKGYVVVNRDTLKTKEKCFKAAEEALDNGKSVVIDNTNPDAASRQPYIQIAKEKGVPARAFVMQTTYDQALHNNQFREIITDGKSKRVPTMVYNMFRKNFKEPTTKDGFSEVVKVNFYPSFEKPEHEELYALWVPE